MSFFGHARTRVSAKDVSRFDLSASMIPLQSLTNKLITFHPAEKARNKPRRKHPARKIFSEISEIPARHKNEKPRNQKFFPGSRGVEFSPETILHETQAYQSSKKRPSFTKPSMKDRNYHQIRPVVKDKSPVTIITRQGPRPGPACLGGSAW